MINLLVTLLIAVIILAVIYYVITTFIPLEPRLRQLVLLIVGMIFLIWLLLALTGVGGVWHLQLR
jgi:uncharacterized membrane protein